MENDKRVSAKSGPTVSLPAILSTATAEAARLGKMERWQLAFRRAAPELPVMVEQAGSARHLLLHRRVPHRPARHRAPPAQRTHWQGRRSHRDIDRGQRDDPVPDAGRGVGPVVLAASPEDRGRRRGRRAPHPGARAHARVAAVAAVAHAVPAVLSGRSSARKTPAISGWTVPISTSCPRAPATDASQRLRSGRGGREHYLVRRCWRHTSSVGACAEGG